MNARVISPALFALVLFVCLARTAQPEAAQLPPVNQVVAQGQDKSPPKQPDDAKKAKDQEKKAPEKKDSTPQNQNQNQNQNQDNDPFSQSNTPNTEQAGGGFNPHMMGDFPGIFARRHVTIFGVLTTTTTTTTTTVGNAGVPPRTTTTTTTTTPISSTTIVLIPYASAGAFKIAENASPRPIDRVFGIWNYYGDLRGPQSGAGVPLLDTTTRTTNNTVVRGPGGAVGQAAQSTATAFVPGAPAVNNNLHREMFGFEKTFLDGNASVELRVPYSQLSSSFGGFGATNFGDMTLITKYALINDRTTGNVLSGGLAITAPTGPRLDTIDGNLHSALLQPWFGYIWNRDRLFVQAFHSVVVPTDSRDITLLFNDLGLGYFLYRGDPGRVLRSIVPTVEAHVTTPLNHRDENSAIFVPDLVVMTSGVHIGLGRNKTLSLGVATPVSGPTPFRIETFMQFNVRF